MRASLPLTALGMGALFFLTDPDAELGVTMCNRAMTAGEWTEYCASPAGVRRRKPKSRVQERADRVAAEVEEGRISDETMAELVESGQTRIIL